jgi:hypothetical protein
MMSNGFVGSLRPWLGAPAEAVASRIAGVDGIKLHY